jgi:hypothetical protein
MDWLEPFSTKMTETADEHFPAPPPPISQYKILTRDSAHLGVQDYGFSGSTSTSTIGSKDEQYYCYYC